MLSPRQGWISPETRRNRSQEYFTKLSVNAVVYRFNRRLFHCCRYPEYFLSADAPLAKLYSRGSLAFFRTLLSYPAATIPHTSVGFQYALNHCTFLSLHSHAPTWSTGGRLAHEYDRRTLPPHPPI